MLTLGLMNFECRFYIDYQSLVRWLEIWVLISNYTLPLTILYGALLVSAHFLHSGYNRFVVKLV